MPNRILSGEVARSESLSRVSRDAAFTFVMLISVADDFGRFDGRARALLAALFPMRDDVDVDQLGRWLDELDREGLIRRYEVDGRPYLELPTWGKYQRLRESKPKFPAPSSPAVSDPPQVAEDRGESPRVAASRGSRARAPDPETQTETETRERTAPTRTSGRAHGAKTPAPERLSDEQRAAVRRWCEDPKHRWALNRLAELEAAMLDFFRGTGELKADWAATMRNWIRRQPEFAPRTTPPSAHRRLTAVEAGQEIVRDAIGYVPRFTPEEVEAARQRREAHRQAIVELERKPTPLADELRDIFVPKGAA